MRAAAAVMLLCLAFSTAGCWDSREPNDMVYGMALGFDIDDEGQYIAMIQFANPVAARPSPGSSAPMSGSGSYSYWTYSAKGHTPAEAVAAMSPYLAHDIALTHIELLLLSERAARHGIAPMIDYIARNWQTRLVIGSAVVDGDVIQLLRAESPMDAIPALAIRRMLGRMRMTDMAPVASDLLTAATRLLRAGSDLILPVLKPDPGGSGEGGQSSGPPTIAPFAHMGAAVFRGDRMVGFLDQKEARGSSYVLGEAGTTSFHVDSPRGGALSMRVVGVKTRVTPSFEGGKASFLIKVRATGYIDGETGLGGGGNEGGDAEPRPQMTDKEFDTHVRARAAQVIREDIQKAFGKSVEYGSDFLELGNAVYRMLPEVWKSGVGDRWHDMLPDVALNIQVYMELSHPGLMRETPLMLETADGGG